MTDLAVTTEPVDYTEVKQKVSASIDALGGLLLRFAKELDLLTKRGLEQADDLQELGQAVVTCVVSMDARRELEARLGAMRERTERHREMIEQLKKVGLVGGTASATGT